MQLRVMTEPQQGATYAELLAAARESEALGFDAFFRSDHLMRIGETDPGPGSTEAWATLAGLARDTSTIRLGTMVSSATFRLPGMLALTVATVDAMSGGRVELGLGGGWYEAEHTAFGVPLPPVGERFDRLEEQLRILTGLWTTPPGESFSFDGAHYTLSGHPALPRPVQQPGPPLIVGGKGPRRTPDLAARFADEFNVPPFCSLEEAGTAIGRVRAACEAVGRDPGSMVLSAAQTLAVADSHAELERRAAAWGGLDLLRTVGLAGTVEDVLDKIGRYRDLGVTRLYLQLPDLHDLDQLRLVAREVMPHL